MTRIDHVINIKDERDFRSQVEGLIELHDFIKANPNSEVKEIAKFMPPVDARVVTAAILEIEARDKKKLR